MSWKPGTPVRLSTRRFVMRSMKRADVNKQFVRWLNDRELREGQNLVRDKTIAARTINNVEKADNRRMFYLLICASVAEMPIGYFAIRADRVHLHAETSVVIADRNFWGKDVVLESRARLIDFIFTELGMHKIVGRPNARNLASIFNYKAQGLPARVYCASN